MTIFRFVIPFLIVLVTGLFFVEEPVLKSIVLAIGGIPLILIFFFRVQILLWWYAKYPPLLDAAMRKVLMAQFAYFKNLSGDNKILFEQRLALFMLNKGFEKKGLKTIPEEVKGFLCAQAVQLTFGMKDYLFPNFDVMVFYPTAFATPQLPQIHTSEIYEEGDNSSMIFAIDSLIEGFTNPKRAFNIGMYEMAEVYRLLFNVEDYKPFETTENFQKLSLIRGATYEGLLENTGKDALNFFSLSIEHFFYNPIQFRELIPNLFSYLEEKFNQNPINTLTPINNFILIK